jgi:hypothetical protein
MYINTSVSCISVAHFEGRLVIITQVSRAKVTSASVCSRGAIVRELVNQSAMFNVWWGVLGKNGVKIIPTKHSGEEIPPLFQFVIIS